MESLVKFWNILKADYPNIDVCQKNTHDMTIDERTYCDNTMTKICSQMPYKTTSACACLNSPVEHSQCRDPNCIKSKGYITRDMEDNVCHDGIHWSRPYKNISVGETFPEEPVFGEPDIHYQHLMSGPFESLESMNTKHTVFEFKRHFIPRK